ncbi:MAG: hypothetical protein AAGF84_07815 [Planctomycetota bacterium]
MKLELNNIRRRWSAVRALAVRLHRDDRGAEALEKLLIVAVVVLPLLGLLIWFRDEIGDWVGDEYQEVVTPGQEDVNPPAGRTGSGP